ncbi:MAG: hypothetical protein JST10_14905 [Bacteroidetes bacterium]|nr:hypothetical protein [Bacteroidota bacterium]
MLSKSELKPGLRFVDLTKDYTEAILMVVVNNPSNGKVAIYTPSNLPEPIGLLELDDFVGEAFPDFNAFNTKPGGRLLEIRDLYAKSIKSFTQKIYSTEKHKITISEAKQFYISLGLTEKEAEGVLKLSIAKGFLDFDKQKSGDFVSLSELLQTFEDKKRFLQAIADEIVSKSQRIEFLVKHSATKGNYRETLLRGVLQKYIPNKYSVATGFIEGCKRQCDVIIYDSHNFSPFFIESDLVVVPQKSVRAVIEVKSTLETKTLLEALDLLADVADWRNFPAPIFKGIFAFRKKFSNDEAIAETVSNYYNNKTEEESKHGISYLYEGVNAICTLNQQCIITDLIDYKFKDLTIRPRLYSIASDIKDLNPFTATFFNELFTYLDFEKMAKKVNVSFFKDLDQDLMYKLEREIYDDTWMPQTSFQKEHDFEFESIWKRISDVTNWRAGNYTIQELEEIYFEDKYKPVDYKDNFSKK